jgi:hypothetical protein
VHYCLHCTSPFFWVQNRAAAVLLQGNSSL